MSGQILYQQHHLGTSAMIHHLMQMSPPLHFCKRGHSFKGNRGCQAQTYSPASTRAGATVLFCGPWRLDFLPLLQFLAHPQLHPEGSALPITSMARRSPQSCPQLGLPGLRAAGLRTAGSQGHSVPNRLKLLIPRADCSQLLLHHDRET